MRDVARRAGVSPATVSAVVNGNKYVSPELVRRVRQACGELGYSPRSRGEIVPGRRSRCIAVIVPSISNPAFSTLLHAIEEVADTRGYGVFLANTGGSAEKARSYMERLLGMRVEGVVASLTWDLAESALIEEFLKRGIHVVGIGGARTLAEIDCFVGDDERAGYDLGKYLLSLGHERCAYIGPPESVTSRLRLNGLRKAYESARLEIQDDLVVQTAAYDQVGSVLATAELLGRARPFSALVVFNDLMAASSLKQLVGQGFRVPADVSLATFGDGFARFTNPELTTMAFSHEVIARDAARALLDRIEGKHAEPPSLHLARARIVIRDSTRTMWSRPIPLNLPHAQRDGADDPDV